MIQRIVSGWSWIRALYLVMGIFVIAQSILDKQWLGIVLGIYVAAMGLFGFGCASGRCYPAPTMTPDKKSDMQDIEFEEIKSK
jgi:hypothetical protein